MRWNQTTEITLRDSPCSDHISRPHPVASLLADPRPALIPSARALRVTSRPQPACASNPARFVLTRCKTVCSGAGPFLAGCSHKHPLCCLELMLRLPSSQRGPRAGPIPILSDNGADVGAEPIGGSRFAQAQRGLRARTQGTSADWRTEKQRRQIPGARQNVCPCMNCRSCKPALQNARRCCG